MKNKLSGPREAKKKRIVLEKNNNEVEVKVSRPAGNGEKIIKITAPSSVVKEEKKNPIKSTKSRAKRPSSLSLLIPLNNNLQPKILSPGSSSTLSAESSASPMKSGPSSTELSPPTIEIPVQSALPPPPKPKPRPKRTRAPRKKAPAPLSLPSSSKEGEQSPPKEEEEEEEELLSSSITCPDSPTSVFIDPPWNLQTRNEFAKNLPPLYSLNPPIKQENTDLSIFTNEDIHDILHDRHLTAKYFRKLSSGNMEMDKNFTRLFNLFAPENNNEFVNKYFDIQGAPGEEDLQVNAIQRDKKNASRRRPVTTAAGENMEINAPGTMSLSLPVVPLNFGLTGPPVIPPPCQFTAAGLRVDDTLFLERHQLDEIMKILDSQFISPFCIK